MRILYLTNGFPFPLTTGYLRHYYFMRALAPAHRITLMSAVGASFHPDHVDGVAPFVERVETFMAVNRGRSVARKIAHRLRHGVREPHLRAMRRAIARELRDTAYDAVMVSGKPTFDALRGLSTPPIIADMCDATSSRLQSQARYVSALRRFWLGMEQHRVRRAEQDMLTQSAHVVFASARDRATVMGDCLERSSVIPNGIDTAFWRRRSSQLGSNAIVFTGAMNYPPNADAAVFLARDILPLVRSRMPDARLFLVGHSPGEQVRATGRVPGVTVTGFVSDVRPYLEEAAVFAAPLRFGAGIQNKLLEALSMEVPAVTSPLAAEGLTTATGLEAPVDRASSARGCAEAICRQLMARRHDRRVWTAGRAYVEKHFSWETSGASLDALLRAAASGDAPRRVA